MSAFAKKGAAYASDRVLDLLRKNPYTPAVKPGRLQLIVALVLGLLAVPLAAEAQRMDRVYRIGVLLFNPAGT